jgi:hypothetical protein
LVACKSVPITACGVTSAITCPTRIACPSVIDGCPSTLGCTIKVPGRVTDTESTPSEPVPEGWVPDIESITWEPPPSGYFDYDEGWFDDEG